MKNEIADTKPESQFSRRSFLQRGAIMGAALPLAGFLTNAAFGQTATGDTPTSGDVAILKFLAAAELLETDLWDQYTELALNNQPYRAALSEIDPSLPEYVLEDFRDENSHQNFINSYLVSVSQSPVDLTPFATLPGSSASGSSGKRRLTNLSALNIDTSYVLRYRQQGNPDFNDSFPQVANFSGQPTIPLTNGLSAAQLRQIAVAASFHFGDVEQGGSSLYANLSLKASALDTLMILTSIGPTEFYHLATFMTSLQGNFKGQRAFAADSMPAPCKFLSSSLPNNSVLRPISTAKAGAVAAVTHLANSGLFTGQSQAFFDAATALAMGADAAVRTVTA